MQTSERQRERERERESDRVKESCISYAYEKLLNLKFLKV